VFIKFLLLRLGLAVQEILWQVLAPRVLLLAEAVAG
jgi:hypothetical protein